VPTAQSPAKQLGAHDPVVLARQRHGDADPRGFRVAPAVRSVTRDRVPASDGVASRSGVREARGCVTDLATSDHVLEIGGGELSQDLDVEGQFLHG